MNAYMQFATRAQGNNRGPYANNIVERLIYEIEMLFLVIDVSGSMLDTDMGDTRLKIACQAGTDLLIVKLNGYPRDSVAIVSFGSVARLIHPPAEVGSNYHALASALDSLEIDGLTHMGAGLKIVEAVVSGKAVNSIRGNRGRGLLAKLLFSEETPQLPRPAQPGIAYRAIVLSDGGDNGDIDTRSVASTLKAAGVIINTIGIGRREEVDEELLKDIASIGPDGSPMYAFINDRATLVNEFRRLGNHLRML